MALYLVLNPERESLTWAARGLEQFKAYRSKALKNHEASRYSEEDLKAPVIKFENGKFETFRLGDDPL